MGKKVLVVDDEKSIVEILTLNLKMKDTRYARRMTAKKPLERRNPKNLI